MLYGAAAARELGLLDDGKIVLHFVCDEETGSVAGSGHLREAGLIDPGALAMVTAEPTGGVVWHASRGAITLRVEVRGRAAHVGQAHLGVNAFEQMVQIAEPLADARARAARAPHGVPAGERRGARLDAGRRRRIGQRRELQRRAGRGLVLRRPALQPRGASRRGARAADDDDRRGRRRRAGAEVERRGRCRSSRPPPPTRGIPPRSRSRAASRRSRARRRASSCARASSTRAGTRSSAFPRSPTAPVGSTSRTARTSTSTRPRCAAAPPSTRCSPARC